ncbi:MAG: NnrU family protein [Methylococcus sp.]
MTALILASLFFTGIHIGIAGTRLRDVLIQRFGEIGFRAGFSVLSLLGLIWLIQAYGQAPYIETWGQWLALKPVVAAFMLLAFILLTFSVTTPNPAAVGGERWLSQGEATRGIYRVTRHPMLWATSLWALLHLLVNGDVRSLILFGSLLVMTLMGTRSIDAKRRRADPMAWGAFEAVTSNLPFLAIREGRNRFEWRELLNWRLAVALLGYLAVMHFHARWFGVSPLF